MNAVAERLLGLIYPPRCIFCHKMLEKCEKNACGSCKSELTGHGSAFRGKSGAFISGAVVPFLYEGSVRDALLRLKYNHGTFAAAAFAHFMLPCALNENFNLLDIMTWVPGSRERTRQRGYCQAELLADELRKTGVMPPMKKTLVKLRNTESQTALTRERRAANVMGAFAAAKDADISGKNILLIDDVITTGATASECARILLTAGAKSVWLLAAAKSPNGK